MAKIITVTLNPTIDKNYFIDHVMADHKLRCKNPSVDAGGGGINVSKGIKELGGSSIALFPSGGRAGKFLEDLLTHAGLEFQALPINEETRESVAVTDTSSNQQYRIVPEGPLMPTGIVDEILKACEKIKPDYLVASGSVPRGLPVDVYARFAALAKKINSRLILDTSGDALKETVAEGVFLLKPNLRELSMLTGVEELELDQVDKAAIEIINRGYCEVAVVSLGASGAMVVTKNVAKHFPAPTVKKRSTVGAGDSMVSGIVWALHSGMAGEDAAAWGVACGTAATMNEGTRLFRKDDAQKLFHWIKSHC